MSVWRLNHQQEQASRRLAGPVLVDAGAGTGKTRMLTARFVNAASGATPDLDPVSVEDIVAITFTEKAAGELAERVRGGLRAIGDDAELARRLDAAWLLTIHGLCSRVLHASAIESRVDPHFGILDEVGRARLEERCFEEASLQLVKRRHRSVFDVFDFDELLAAVRRVEAGLRVAMITPAEVKLEGAADPGRIVERAIACFEGSALKLGECGVADDRVDANSAACLSTAESLRRLLESGLDAQLAAEEAWRVLASHVHETVPRDVAYVRNELEDDQTALLQELAAVVLGPSAIDLRDLLADYASRLRAAKREAGVLDFDDLQIETVRLLEGSQGLRDRYRERCRLVMVDEFQDTDSLQLRLVRLLAPENLCTVGDERQSIYGFRGAQVDVYRQHVRDMTEAGAPTYTLAENYRSHPDVLDFVNDVFGSRELFGDSFVRLHPARREEEGLEVGDTSRVEILLAANRRGAPSGDARRRCAAAIARRFARLRDEHAVPSSSMAVLVRSYTHADEYAAALRERGFPVLVLGGRRFFALAEVGALRALCRVLANPEDEHGLGVVLLSALGRMSDASMLRLRRATPDREAGGLWDALLRADALLEPEEAHNAARIMSALERAGALVGARPLSEVILRAVEYLDYDLVILSRGDQGRQAYANVLKFARMADEYERAEGAGPAGFVEWLDLRERAGTKESPASIADDGSPAVRIMSIHAAKGLEFPVVAVPGLEEGQRADDPAARCRVTEGVGELALRIPSAWAPGTDAVHRRTPLFSELRESHIAAEAEERARLFYVACTRARDVLILASGSPQRAPSAQSMLASLWSALEWDPKLESIRGGDRSGPRGSRYRLELLSAEVGAAEPPTAARAKDTSGPLDSPAGVTPASVASLARPTDTAPVEARLGDPGSDALALSSAAGPPRAVSYTGLASFRRCGLRFLAERLVRVGRLENEGSTAARRGSAVHAVLQAGGTEIGPDRIAAISRFHDVPEGEAASVLRSVEIVERSSAERTLRGFETVRREAKFAIPVGHSESRFLLVGSMDAYGRRAADALVIDYKTGADAPDPSDERWALQAACYALAAARDGATSIRVVFVHAPAGGSDSVADELDFEFDPEGLAGFEEQLILDYESIRAGRFDPLPERDPVYCPSCPIGDGVCPVGRPSV